MTKISFLLPILLLLNFNVASAKDILIAGQDYPPFNWEENKEIKGGMVDVMKDMCKEVKHTCKFQIVNLARGLKMLEDGEVDIFMSLFKNPEREAFAAFSPDIIMTDIVYAAKSENKISKFKSVDDLSGMTAAGVRNASSTKVYLLKDADKVKNVIVKEETDNKSLVERLINDFHGKKHVIIGSEDVIRYFTKQAGGHFDVVWKHNTEGFKVGFSKKKFAAGDIEKMNQVIEKLKKDGSVKKVLIPYGLKAN